MAAPPTVAASYDNLMRNIANRDRAALAELHRLLVRPIFAHVRARLDDTTAARAITRAAFVEVWRLAPQRKRFDDPRGWLLTIADRRTVEHLRSRAWPAPLDTVYDEHIASELTALIRNDPPDAPATITRRLQRSGPRSDARWSRAIRHP